MMKFNFILPVLFISQISAAAIVTKLTCEATQPRASVKSVNLLMDTTKKYPNNLSLEMEVFTGDKLTSPIVRIESTPDGSKYFIPKNIFGDDGDTSLFQTGKQYAMVLEPSQALIPQGAGALVVFLNCK